MSEELKDKIAVVTGAAQGLGLGIPRRWAEEGAAVISQRVGQANRIRAIGVHDINVKVTIAYGGKDDFFSSKVHDSP